MGNPSAMPSRYKHVFMKHYYPYLAHSPDGLTPTNYSDDPVHDIAADTNLNLQWLPRAQTYLLIVRSNLGTPFGWREVHRLYLGIADGMPIARVWTCRYSK